MVNARGTVRWFDRLLFTIRQDWRRCLSAIRTNTAMRSGLFTYNVRPAGGTRRLHLRIESDGTGVLLIDAMDVVHLNPSAAVLVKSALDGLTKEQAVSAIKSRFTGLKKAEIERDADEMYALAHHLATTTNACPTCRVSTLDKKPLFSTRVAAPYKVDLALTYGCNNACSHCYNRVESFEKSNSPKNGKSMSLAQWENVLCKLAEVGVPHVIFTGGEPTLFAVLEHLIRKAEQLGLISGLNTNGRRLADSDYAKTLADAGLSHVQITLQSSRADVHNAMCAADSFAETRQGIINCIDAGLHTITNTTLTRRNVDFALEAVDFLHSLGLRTFAMNGIIFSGHGLNCGDAIDAEKLYYVLAGVRNRATELGMRFLWYTPTEYCRLSPLELELGARRCNAGEYSMCIEPNGDVIPCQSYYVPVGNILRDPWHKIWNNDLFRSFRDRVKNPRAAGLPTRCWTCLDLAICGGGCRLEREIVDSGRRSVESAK